MLGSMAGVEPTKGNWTNRPLSVMVTLVTIKPSLISAHFSADGLEPPLPPPNYCHQDTSIRLTHIDDARASLAPRGFLAAKLCDLRWQTYLGSYSGATWQAT